ncbi:MAG: hypothetical protein WCY15_11885 [Phenylobacterium sp.]|jgi:post-segregation antitoxin (ccd killing protein)|nr:hypothetical protein [Phenylobacterium sp.]MDX9999123.1 hypothetical protein [Phenylobacterium sp.]
MGKAALRLEIDADLLAKAKETGVDVSAIAEGRAQEDAIRRALDRIFTGF